MKGKKVDISKPRKATKSKRSPYWKYGLVFLIILLAALIRLRLLGCPLERDEGEYAYAGQLILQGIPPYQLAYNMKLPGTYAAYALIMAIFGQTPNAIHIGLLLINASSALLIYFLGARLFGTSAGLVACASFVFLSVGQSVLGTAAHATHFVILPALGGTLLLLKAIEQRRTSTFLWSGLLFGLAFVMKQPGIFFVVFAMLYYSWCEWRARPVNWRSLAARGGLLSLGALMPFGLTCLMLRAAGVIERFWFWTFSYAREYATNLTVSQGIQKFSAMAPKIVDSFVLIWVIAGVGLVALICDRKAREKIPFLLGLLLFSFLAVCSGFYFRQHYFILMLPAVALLAGFAVSFMEQYFQRTGSLVFVPLLAFIAALGFSISQQSAFLFEMDPVGACRAMYGLNPFPESLEIAKYLQDHTSAAGRVAILGSEPQIYFHSRRHSATGYIYTYGLMEEQKYALRMQKEMISEIEKARPEYAVVVNVPSSWLLQANSETAIFTWANQYLQNQYTLDGIVDILSEDQTVYRWGDEAIDYQPRSPINLSIYKRKSL
jgi:hypothetical protein